MLKLRIILPAIVIALPATIVCAAQVVRQSSTNVCRSSPGSPAPRGSHWYYRSHGQNQYCWYLGTAGMLVRSHGLPALSHVVSPSSAPQEEDAAGTTWSPAQMTPTPTPPMQSRPAVARPSGDTFLESLAGEQVPAIGFAGRWPDPSNSVNLHTRDPAGKSDSLAAGEAATDAAEPGPLPRPAVAVARAGMQQDSVGTANFSSVFVVGVLLLASLLFGGLFKLSRHFHGQALYLANEYEDMPAESDETAAGMPMPDGQHDAPTPTDPADDLKTSLQELMHDLRRADAASGLPLTGIAADLQRAIAARKVLRSFAPRAHLASKGLAQRKLLTSAILSRKRSF